jgi:hypothetical protein
MNKKTKKTNAVTLKINVDADEFNKALSMMEKRLLRLDMRLTNTIHKAQALNSQSERLDTPYA